LAYGAETYTLGMARSAENLDVAKRENSAILVEENYNERYASFNPNSSESYIIFEFMQDEYMKQSVSLARSIQKHYVNIAGRQNKGVHQAGFLVLRETSMPSVLTELGFISTPAEEAYLNSDDGIKKLGRAIYEGFLDYKQAQDGKKRATPPYKNVDETGTPVPSENNNEPTAQTPVPDTSGDNGDIIIINDTSRLNDTPTKNDDGGSVLGKHFGGNKEEQTSEPAAQTPAQEKPAADNKQAETNNEAITFKIQFITSDTPLKTSDKRLQNVNGLESYTEAGITKYTCMPTTSYTEAIKNQKQVRQKYPDAFIVAFKGEKRINLGEAIKESRNKKQ